MNMLLKNVKDIFRQKPLLHYKPIILCDFDGTISLNDVTDTLLTHFAKKDWQTLEQQWVDGKIGSRECMRKQIALLDASQTEINQVLDTIEIDPKFVDFVHGTKDKIDIHILSDGLDYAIMYILKRHNLEFLPVIANKLSHDGTRGWNVEFPFANSACLSASGNCKCQTVRKCKLHYRSVFYIGDGASDFCVSHRVDLVFAKNKLIDYCKTHKIHYYPIADFTDVIRILSNWLGAHFFSRNPRNTQDHDH